MLKKAINVVDMGLLMGNEFRNELTKTASLLCKTLQKNYIGIQYLKMCLFTYSKMFLFLDSPALIYKNSNLNDINHTFDKIGNYVPTIHQPSLETFLRDFLKPKLPVKISG